MKKRGDLGVNLEEIQEGGKKRGGEGEGELTMKEKPSAQSAPPQEREKEK